MVKADGYGLGAIPWPRPSPMRDAPSSSSPRSAKASTCVSAARGRHLHACGRSPGHHRATDRSRSHPGVDQHRADRTLVLAVGRTTGRLRCSLHLDTGMNRTGLDAVEATAPRRPLKVQHLDVVHVMSHLASADAPDSTQNEHQLAAYRRIRAGLPMGVASLANTPGIALGPAYHFDHVRPGIGLYGCDPSPGKRLVCSRSFTFTHRCFRSAPSAPATRSVTERPTRRQGVSCRNHRGGLWRRFLRPNQAAVGLR